MKLRGKKNWGNRVGMDLIKSHYRQAENTQAIRKHFKKDEEKTLLSCIQRNHRKPAPSVFFCSWEVLLLNSYRETRVYQLGDRSSQRCGGMTEVEVLRTRRLGESFTGRFSCEISLGTAFS